MTLSLDPVSQSPFEALVDAVKAKIEDRNLSFYKYLNAIGSPLQNVFTQQGGDLNSIDPPGSSCPAVVLLASAFPPVDDQGVGDERWYFALTVLFKMRLPANKDADPGFRACWELVRTIMAGWRQPQLDPIGSVTGMADYRIDGNLTPHISDAEGGKAYARLAFDVQFRFNNNILGGGIT